MSMKKAETGQNKTGQISLFENDFMQKQTPLTKLLLLHVQAIKRFTSSITFHEFL